METENNFEKVLSWLRENQPELLRKVDGGDSVAIQFQHDHWCGLMHGMRCDCAPDLFVEDKQVVYPKGVLS